MNLNTKDFLIEISNYTAFIKPLSFKLANNLKIKYY